MIKLDSKEDSCKIEGTFPDLVNEMSALGEMLNTEEFKEIRTPLIQVLMNSAEFTEKDFEDYKTNLKIYDRWKNGESLGSILGDLGDLS